MYVLTIVQYNWWTFSWILMIFMTRERAAVSYFAIFVIRVHLTFFCTGSIINWTSHFPQILRLFSIVLIYTFYNKLLSFRILHILKVYQLFLNSFLQSLFVLVHVYSVDVIHDCTRYRAPFYKRTCDQINECLLIKLINVSIY